VTKQGTPDGFRAGHIAIVGRPNVGKSTLLNHLVGAKLSITSRKAQTTRQRITGILTTDDAQYAFVDTPGFQTKHRSALNDMMNRSVRQSLADVDVVLFVVEASKLTMQDRALIPLLPERVPVIAVVNKIDRLADKALLLPYLEALAKLHPFAAIVPISAERGAQVPELLAETRSHMPEGPAHYDADTLTDRDERFLAAELVREKIFRLLGEEVPYATTVMIEKFEHEGKLRRIFAVVVIDKPNQKAILLGEKGERMKRIASEARVDMESLFGGKVYLEVFVRVKSGWADDARVLKRLGY
jgi:GTP-binding protein Era